MKDERYTPGDIVCCLDCGKEFTIKEEDVFAGFLDKYIRCPMCGGAHSFFMYQTDIALKKFMKDIKG